MTSTAVAGGVRLRAARLITELLAPIVLIFVLLVLVAVHSTGSVVRGLVLGLVAAFFAGGLPYAVLILGVRRGRLGDRHLSRRQERPALMALGLGSVTCGYFVMRWLDAPGELLALVAAMVAGVAVALVVSLFWKISVHTACVAGSVCVVAILVHPATLVLAPLIVATAWARVTLRDHTPAQVLVGALVGAAVASAVVTAASSPSVHDRHSMDVLSTRKGIGHRDREGHDRSTSNALICR